MKTFIAAALGAALLAGAATAQAATSPHAANATQGNVARWAMVGTPLTYGSGHSDPAPQFSYPVTVPYTVLFNKSGKIVLPDGAPALVNETGGGR